MFYHLQTGLEMQAYLKFCFFAVIFGIHNSYYLINQSMNLVLVSNNQYQLTKWWYTVH